MFLILLAFSSTLFPISFATLFISALNSSPVLVVKNSAVTAPATNPRANPIKTHFAVSDPLLPIKSSYGLKQKLS